MKPADCRSMAEVRHGIDRLDEQIVPLLAERLRYMEAAARIKQDRGAVRDERRKAEVIANARRVAAEEGVPVQAIGEIYERLVESSISYEFEQFDRARAPLMQPRSSADED
jgi:isochorismate pyruvate lyase